MAKDGLLKLKGVRIEKRLKRAFNMVTVIAAVATFIGLIAMIVVTANFKKAMYNYALPQGDIALFMNEYAESRSNMRGIIGYEDQDLIDSLVERHDMRRESTYERLAAIEETMVTPEGRAAYEEIEKALDAYFEMEAEVIKIGATDQAASVEELQASMDELTHGLERCAEDMGSAFVLVILLVRLKVSLVKLKKLQRRQTCLV